MKIIFWLFAVLALFFGILAGSVYAETIVTETVVNKVVQMRLTDAQYKDYLDFKTRRGVKFSVLKSGLARSKTLHQLYKSGNK